MPVKYHFRFGKGEPQRGVYIGHDPLDPETLEQMKGRSVEVKSQKRPFQSRGNSRQAQVGNRPFHCDVIKTLYGTGLTHHIYAIDFISCRQGIPDPTAVPLVSKFPPKQRIGMIAATAEGLRGDSLDR